MGDVIFWGGAAAIFYTLWKVMMPSNGNGEETAPSSATGPKPKFTPPRVTAPITQYAGVEGEPLIGGKEGPQSSQDEREHEDHHQAVERAEQAAQEEAESALQGGGPVPENPFREPESLKDEIQRQYKKRGGSFDDSMPVEEVEDSSRYSSVLDDVKAADREEQEEEEEKPLEDLNGEGYDPEGPVRGETEE